MGLSGLPGVEGVGGAAGDAGRWGTEEEGSVGAGLAPPVRTFLGKVSAVVRPGSSPQQPRCRQGPAGEGAAALKRHFRGSVGSQALRGEVRLPWTTSLPSRFYAAADDCGSWVAKCICMGLRVLSEGLF